MTSDARTVHDLRRDIHAAVGADSTYTKVSREAVVRALHILRGEDPESGVYDTTREVAIRRQLADEVGFEYNPSGNRSLVYTRDELQQIEQAINDTEDSA